MYTSTNAVHVYTCSMASLFSALPISTFITVAQADHTSDLWVVTCSPFSFLKNDYAQYMNKHINLRT